MFRKIRAVETVAKPVEKRIPLAIEANSKFVYKGGADVLKLWQHYGFVPPSEYREDYLFKKNREMKDV
jgi:hypothetical protein